jgi:hypothetical protein
MGRSAIRGSALGTFGHISFASFGLRSLAGAGGGGQHESSAFVQAALPGSDNGEGSRGRWGLSSRPQERVETRRPSVRSGSASPGTRAVT